MVKDSLLPLKGLAPFPPTPAPRLPHQQQPRTAPASSFSSNLTPRRLFLPLSLLAIILLTFVNWRFGGGGGSSSSAPSKGVLGYFGPGSRAGVDELSSAEGLGRWSTTDGGRSSAQGPDPWLVASEALPVEAGLGERLRAWEESPREEPANWVTKNLQVSVAALDFARATRC